MYTPYRIGCERVNTGVHYFLTIAGAFLTRRAGEQLLPVLSGALPLRGAHAADLRAARVQRVQTGRPHAGSGAPLSSPLTALEHI